MGLVRQRGSILIYGLVALFVAMLASGFVFSYNRAIARAERAEAQLAEVKRQLAAERLPEPCPAPHQHGFP